MIADELQRETMLLAVKSALGVLTRRDAALLQLCAHELAVVHRFAVYLEYELRDHLSRQGLTVDLDYDRHGHGRKVLPARTDRAGEARFRPDLIVHRRLTDSANLLVVEWKKDGTKQTLDTVKSRIRSLVDKAPGLPDYRYETGIIVDSCPAGVRWRSYVDSEGFSAWEVIAIE